MKIRMVPTIGGRRPGPFEAAGDGIGPVALATRIHPSKSLGVQLLAFRVGAQGGGVTVTVGLAHGMAAGRKSHGFFVVHGHPRKGGSDILGRAQRIGLTVHAFGVHVNETHLDGGQRIRQRIAIHGVGVTVFGQPFLLATPIHVLFGMPNVFATTCKTKGFETHGFVGHVPRQNH